MSSIIHETYQRRGYLTREGYSQLDRAMIECAGLYNAALQERRDAYRHPDRVHISYNSQQGQFVHIRHEDAFWGSVSQQVGRGVLRRVDRAFQSFFRRVKRGETPGYPRFKSSRRWKTIDLAEVSPGMVKDGKVKVKGLPTIRFKGGELPDSTQLKSLRITRRGRRVTVSLGYAVESCPLPATEASVGLDLGITERITLSNGEGYDRRVVSWHDVAEQQRRLARSRKGSREWRKRARILANARNRERISNRNACHRITSEIVRRYGHIGIEDLGIVGMTASARGTAEAPGTNVSAKSGLNREIRSQTWGMIREQLEYKAEWAGRTLVAVDPRYTSQTCSRCGLIDRLSRRGKVFRCVACGYEGDPDVNAARNILRKSLTGREMAGGNAPPLACEPV